MKHRSQATLVVARWGIAGTGFFPFRPDVWKDFPLGRRPHKDQIEPEDGEAAVKAERSRLIAATRIHVQHLNLIPFTARYHEPGGEF